MNDSHSQLVYRYYIILLIIIINTPDSAAQIGLQAPDHSPRMSPDSSNVFYGKPILPLRNWNDRSDQFLQLKQGSDDIDISVYISPNILPRDPFKIDLRGTSNYVPRMVRDELNLIMNRPKDNAFVPVLPAAYLALQLASKYLLVRKKTEITYLDIERGKEGIPLLEELWKQSPQTLTELYNKQLLRDKYTMVELQKLVEILIENKLVKRKLIENAETKYFFALDKFQYDQLVERGRTEQPSLNIK